ncbi:MAG TPA: type II secretion system protein GspK [Candidatus Omnitrophota bacterium]|nr:type II secretion system protein GspK [Candidatus Omnitrophota bacterium]
MERKGSVLIVVLWVLAVLSLLTVSLALLTRLNTQMASGRLKRIETREHLESAVQFARYLIESDPHPQSDHPGDPWFGKHDLSEWLPETPIEIDIRDEEGKINVNLASPELLKTLFGILIRNGKNLDTDIEELSASIVRWRGNEASFGTPTSYPNKKAPFESLEELLLIERITARDFETIKPFLTVYSPRGDLSLRVNINTAPDEIIETLLQTVPGDEFSKQALLNALRAALQDAWQGKQRFFRSEDLTPAEFLRKLNLSTTSQTIALSGQLTRFLTVNSAYFSVSVRDPSVKNLSAGITAVIGPSTGRSAAEFQATVQGPAFFRSDALEILSWRERL